MITPGTIGEMAVFHVSASSGKAYCVSGCAHALYSLFMKTGCGYRVAVCPGCKQLYVLYTNHPFSEDSLMDYLDHKASPEHYPWEWLRIQDYCLAQNGDMIMGARKKPR